jgi:hypothetical protein
MINFALLLNTYTQILASTPRVASGKKKKVKTPVVTVTPPVKRFRANVQLAQKTEKRKEEKKKVTQTKNDEKPLVKNTCM